MTILRCPSSPSGSSLKPLSEVMFKPSFYEAFHFDDDGGHCGWTRTARSCRNEASDCWVRRLHPQSRSGSTCQAQRP